MSEKRSRRRPRKDDELNALPDEGKRIVGIADSERRAAPNSLDEMALETQRRSISYGRARGVA